MYKYKVGHVIESFKGIPEGVKFDMTDEGAVLSILFNKPTQKEIEEIKKGSLQFGMFMKNNIIFILSKFGSMQWMDAPYTIHLSKNLTELNEISEGEGYSCHIVLADASSGEIKAMRLIGFDTQYSKILKANIEEQSKKEFEKVQYDVDLFEVMTNYTTKDMVNYSEVNCRIR